MSSRRATPAHRQGSRDRDVDDDIEDVRLVAVERALECGPKVVLPVDALAVRPVAALAPVLTSAGAPARDVAAGVEAGSPGRLRLLFHVRPAQEPPPPFATGSGQ